MDTDVQVVATTTASLAIDSDVGQSKCDIVSDIVDPPVKMANEGLTQNDCVVWDESHNLDLRRVLSPAIYSPKTPSTRGLSSTCRVCDQPNDTSGSFRTRVASLRNVTKYLADDSGHICGRKKNVKFQQSNQEDEQHIGINSRKRYRYQSCPRVNNENRCEANNLSPLNREEKENMNSSFNLYSQPEESNNRLIHPQCVKASTSFSSPSMFPDLFQDLLKEVNSHSTPTENDETTTTTLLSQLSITQPRTPTIQKSTTETHKSHQSVNNLQDVNSFVQPFVDNVVYRATCAGVDILNSNAMPPLSDTCSNSIIDQSAETSLSLMTLNKSINDPPNVLSGSPFGGIKFSHDDLVLIDSMIERATQPEENAVPDTDSACPASTKQLRRRSGIVSDVFDTFTDLDFDALDKSIADHQQQQHLLRSIDSNHPFVTDQSRCSPDAECLQFSRYVVLNVKDDPARFLKTIYVRLWNRDVQRDSGPSVRAFPLPLGRNSSDKTSFNDSQGQIYLRGDWYYTPLSKKDIIHVCSLSGQHGTNIEALPITLDTHLDDDLLLIVHPDMLVTPTTISETISCARRAVLKNRLGSSVHSSQALVFGTLRHALFESMINERDFSLLCAQKYCLVIVRRHAEALAACGVASRDAEIELMKFFPQIERFANEYTSFGRPMQLESCPPNLLPKPGHAQPCVRFMAKEIDALEEPIISPELGLKGNIDMVVQAEMTDFSVLKTINSLLSVELKTGQLQRTQTAHRAQLEMYALLLRVRYGSSSAIHSTAGNEGVLLYMNNENVKAAHISPRMFELKALVSRRNLVAIETCRSLKPRGVLLKYQNEQEVSSNIPRIELLDPTPATLPGVLTDVRSCEKCYMSRECMVYAGISEAHFGSDNINSVMKTHKEFLSRFTGMLKPEDIAYFLKWDRLVDLEANHSGLSRIAEAWLIPSHERETTTLKCISSLLFVESSMDNSKSCDCDVQLVFQRNIHYSRQASLQTLSFESGCPVIISSDIDTASSSEKRSRSHMYIVRGVFISASDHRVAIRAKASDLLRLQKVTSRSKDGEDLLFRIDRDETVPGFCTLRQNLVDFISCDCLPSSDSSTSEFSTFFSSRLSKLRDIIVRLKRPVFADLSQQTMFDPPSDSSATIYPGCDLMDIFMDYSKLNEDQRAAVSNVFAALDFSMIQGLPGTGKTSTIALVSRLLVAHGKRVLIIAYTNSAVDNVLLKLVHGGLAAVNHCHLSPAVIRVGRESSIHPGIHPILVNTAAIALECSNKSESNSLESLPSADYLSKCIQDARIVGTTALTLPKSPLLAKEQFDVVIVDEAGQLTQPAAIGALMPANSFVLVGDHKQLPPLVTNEFADLGGYGESMLKRLAEAHPNSVVMLSYQYRMNQEICKLSNEITYNGALKCANEVVANQQLELPGFPESLSTSCEESLLKTILHPLVPVCFVNTDKESNVGEAVFVPLERSIDRTSGGSIVNDIEASIVRTMVENLLRCGMDPSRLGVICPFKAQIRLLDESDQVKAWRTQGLEISTIDRYQGRDKDVIILSFVRSNSKGNIGRLLEDSRRLNVAVTRAKCKLIMIGSFRTLFTGSEPLRRSLARLEREGHVLHFDTTIYP